MTLVELLVATAIMSILAGSLVALTTATQQGSTYSTDYSTALQHGRVTLERIDYILSGAYSTPGHPAAAVYVETIGNYRYPDTLIIWHPAGTPANVNGPPLVSECYFYCWDPTTPSTLIELTNTSNTSTIPLDATLQTGAWKATLDSLKTSSSSKKTVLTTLLRPCSVSTNGSSVPSGTATTRGAVRFNLTVSPSLTEYSNYQAGSTTWGNMSWPQGLFASTYGVRQVWLATELQLMPASKAGTQDPTGLFVIPMFGSSTLYYTMSP